MDIISNFSNLNENFKDNYIILKTSNMVKYGHPNPDNNT